jgi:hypothetical protein
LFGSSAEDRLYGLRLVELSAVEAAGSLLAALPAMVWRCTWRLSFCSLVPAAVLFIELCSDAGVMPALLAVFSAGCHHGGSGRIVGSVVGGINVGSKVKLHAKLKSVLPCLLPIPFSLNTNLYLWIFVSLQSWNVLQPLCTFTLFFLIVHNYSLFSSPHQKRGTAYLADLMPCL